MYLEFLVVCAVISLGGSEAANVPLNDFIGHFEGLTYSKNELIRNHERLKRTTSGKRHFELKFTALKKNFHFELYPDTSVFSKDFKLSVNGRLRRHADMSVYYSGRAIGDPRTTIRGDVSHGVFVGTITTPDEDYHIEPASHHFKEEQPFHSVICRGSDVRYDAIKGQPCGLSDHTIIKKMAEDQKRTATDATIAYSALHKRQAPNRSLTRCKLFLRGDARFYREVTTASFSQEQRITQAKAYLRRAVASANAIYEFTSFFGTGGIGFEIAGMDILTEDTGMFANDFIGVQAFLKEHSIEDFSSYCAAYRFTYRDFTGGVLGLAYVAQSGANGGICSRSLNTGIVTLLNYGRRVPEGVSHLTFAHELGHNFGSQHDPPTAECQPTINGKYIMFESASTGSDPNNNQFSTCSINMMEPIISFAQMDSGCFIEDPGDCGNGVLDDGEVCDCMFNFDETTGLCDDDRCCNGSSCTLARGAVCSPSVDFCCTDSCTVVTDTSVECSVATECASAAYCDGVKSKCPTPQYKAGVNGSVLACQNNTGTCLNGTCTGSLCLLLDMEECQCTSVQEACNLCCKPGNPDSTCSVATKSSNPLAANLSNMLPPGGFCLAANGESGYCDFTGKCRSVDGNGALNQLTDFFTSTEFQMALEWITNMWWVLVVAVVCLLGIMFVIVLICHFTLPKPKYQKEKVVYRETLRRYRQSEHERRRQARVRAQHRVYQEGRGGQPPSYHEMTYK